MDGILMKVNEADIIHHKVCNGVKELQEVKFDGKVINFISKSSLHDDPFIGFGLSIYELRVVELLFSMVKGFKWNSCIPVRTRQSDRICFKAIDKLSSRAKFIFYTYCQDDTDIGTETYDLVCFDEKGDLFLHSEMYNNYRYREALFLQSLIEEEKVLQKQREVLKSDYLAYICDIVTKVSDFLSVENTFSYNYAYDMMVSLCDIGYYDDLKAYFELTFVHIFSEDRLYSNSWDLSCAGDTFIRFIDAVNVHFGIFIAYSSDNYYDLTYFSGMTYHVPMSANGRIVLFSDRWLDSDDDLGLADRDKLYLGKTYIECIGSVVAPITKRTMDKGHRLYCYIVNVPKNLRLPGENEFWIRTKDFKSYYTFIHSGIADDLYMKSVFVTLMDQIVFDLDQSINSFFSRNCGPILLSPANCYVRRPFMVSGWLDDTKYLIMLDSGHMFMLANDFVNNFKEILLGMPYDVQIEPVIDAGMVLTLYSFEYAAFSSIDKYEEEESEGLLGARCFSYSVDCHYYVEILLKQKLLAYDVDRKCFRSRMLIRKSNNYKSTKTTEFPYVKEKVPFVFRNGFNDYLMSFRSGVIMRD